ncbi:MAG TPA: PQQ-binding-like beta-propeller repeat protein [Thiomonas arsenitoxydans]|mgnify:CR=1 FL=1|jgi:type IV pilus assembly protein PilY1|nr:PQQ-binding-like beta-propeller repeat protein [Thiomonas sp.]HOI65064.1 PQQ-binding-like beta-propeller repeat protein [Thiomonas arsenitoxydans]
MKKALKTAVVVGVSVGLTLSPWSMTMSEAGTVTTSQPRPQVVIAIGNSQSMDGDLSGAIMTGSGNLSSGLTSLYKSSSPVNYSVPSGFTPPMTPSQTASAPYTYNNNGTLVDNGASRLNVAKAGLSSVLNKYLPSMDFALEDYSTSGTSLYTTWVYYMSPSGGFTFANSLPTHGFTSYSAYQSFVAANPNASPAPTRWVNNPCYQYGSASSSVKSYCSSIANSGLYGSSASTAASTLSSNLYMQIGASSDDPNINDVLYSSGQPGLFVDYGGAYAAYNYSTYLGPITSTNTPYTYFNLGNYNDGVVSVGYNKSAPSANKVTGPTNAGYVPYTDQVVYAERGFGYYVQSLNATSGNQVVSMTNLGTNPSTSAVNTALTPFTTALKPETNNSSSSEIKALAYQSPTAGLVQGAGNVLSNLIASCAGQYVILVTDGLPTMDLNGKNWPPLGSAAGQGYGVNAAFYGIAGNSNYGINDDSNNLPSGQTQGALDAANTNDQALIDTITAIQALNKKGIKTYVVGLGAGVDANANPAAYAALNAMAIAGGTGQEYPANNVTAFNSALGSIAAQIFSSTAISAPVAPSILQAGSLVYTATSSNTPGSIAGHIQAYQTVAAPTSSASAPIGTPTGPAQWDAGDTTHMSASARQAALLTTTATAYGSGPGSGDIDTLQNVGGNSTSANYNPSSFALSATTCVPNLNTLLAYTFDPSFNSAGDTTNTSALGFPAGVPGCSYLAGRQLNWMLGSLSANDQSHYLGAPSNSNDVSIGGYGTFANSNKGRENLLTFTSNDGFLYAVDAKTGNLVWGWMPQVFLPSLQNFTQFETQQPFDGGYTLTDAVNTASSPQASNWATYVVGTAQGGAYHYALKLSSNTSSSSTAAPAPVAQTWGITVPGGSSPQMQTPLIVNIGGMQYAVFVVNTTTGSGSSAITTSTLYEVNVATGQAASGSTLSAALSMGSNVYVTSALNFDANSKTLWMGDNQGGIWALNLSGTASLDASLLQNYGATSPAAAINYLGYAVVSGVPYVWAASQSQISVFQLSGASSRIVWASSNQTGSKYVNGSLQSVSSNVVMPLQANGQISATPAIIAGVLVVPVYVPPDATSCGLGNGYDDLFDLPSGGLPKLPITFKNMAVTNGVLNLGPGVPLSPSSYASSSGSFFFTGTNASTDSSSGNGNPTGFGAGGINYTVRNPPIAWRQY